MGALLPTTRRVWLAPRVVAAALALLLGIFAAACGGGSPTGGASPVPDPEAKLGASVVGEAGEEVRIVLAEWSLAADRSSAPAGNVTFKAKNPGKEPHELVVMRTDLPPGGLVVDPASRQVDEARSGQVIGEIEPVDLPAGGESAASFYLVPGNYVLLCNVPEHYQKGMWAPFSVSGAVGGNLVVYSGRSQALVDPIIQQFAQATGIKVEVKYGGTPQIAATLLEEGKRSPADIFYAQDPGGIGAVEGMLSPLPQSLLERVPAWARAADGRWVGVSARARVVAYNTKRLKPEDLPDDIYDLVDPRWKGRIGWAPTNGSLQAMVTAMRALWGEAKTRQWLEGLKANDAKAYSGNTQIVTAVGSGEIDVGLVNHYYLYQFLAQQGESFPVRNYHPRAGGPGAMVMVSGAGILETAKNRGNAERFLQFLLSVVGQQYFASQTYEYPLVEGVRLQFGLAPLSEIRDPGVPMKNLADMAGTVKLLQDVGVL
ncbi:MAG: extracellular solute-binding protein [Chloroflexi bacterium]|nr:extracellular solute-binding protein [Chloroflexota bacterium]